MTSINSYQRHVDDEQLTGVLAAAGIEPNRLASRVELGEASYNTAYRIRLTDGSGLVLKVAPDPSMPGLSYERDLMRTETLFYRTASGALPVPEVVHADFSRALIDSDFLLMTELPGGNWYALRDSLAHPDRDRLRRDLGGLVAGLHRITGPEFGYPHGTTSPSWRTAFLGMLDALLEDALRWQTPLPRSVTQIRQLIGANAYVLDDVTTPVLVHFDLWPGNILLHNGQITGIVDGERAFWGDPLAEMVSLALFGTIEDDTAFLEGYGDIEFDDSARRRLALYRAYLYLIMLVEGDPRGYSGPDRESLVKLTSLQLRKALTELQP
ncbi:phosphotransferase family protein [Kutzneria kofuensis]|uniref:Aminoglycoside phosphotransferase (APT) family kinase protein n=1 Tax=Kutzneria kofuensis TaxID=103725 RepID=A0A7W9KEW4_9PSEU|nr:aminoglycoside phosphotransferase family protein [Kutzneria kofuensis]MBB5891251.1 aminoglycoside phosphotransferase (APT) family kinase protein [Kutzneria kofuensis]